MSDLVAASEIASRIQALRQILPPHVRIVAVTKTFPASVVRHAYAAGIRDFGENKVQEAMAKQAELSDLKDVTWHLIGHLQSNKARRAVQLFDWIHTIDSWELAQKLDQLAGQAARQPIGCLQVKILSDPTKYGLTIEALSQILPQLDRLEHLRIRGLMTIPPYGLSLERTQSVFATTQKLANDINQMGLTRLKIEHLSMGMSADFHVAIATGATLIRLGTYLFGPREQRA
jgi:PLP dependent protein